MQTLTRKQSNINKNEQKYKQIDRAFLNVYKIVLRKYA
jgi:hypothetical protein